MRLAALPLLMLLTACAGGVELPSWLSGEEKEPKLAASPTALEAVLAQPQAAEEKQSAKLLSALTEARIHAAALNREQAERSLSEALAALTTGGTETLPSHVALLTYTHGGVVDALVVPAAPAEGFMALTRAAATAQREGLTVSGLKLATLANVEAEPLAQPLQRAVEALRKRNLDAPLAPFEEAEQALGEVHRRLAEKAEALPHSAESAGQYINVAEELLERKLDNQARFALDRAEDALTGVDGKEKKTLQKKADALYATYRERNPLSLQEVADKAESWWDMLAGK